MLKQIKFPKDGDKEFTLTLNGKPYMVTVEKGSYYNGEDYCCAWFAGMAGGSTACSSCRASWF
jgi:hypothetical protein